MARRIPFQFIIMAKEFPPSKALSALGLTNNSEISFVFWNTHKSECIEKGLGEIRTEIAGVSLTLSNYIILYIKCMHSSRRDSEMASES